MVISKETWRKILAVLKENKISYTTHYEKRDIQRAMEYPDVTVLDEHIQINLVIRDCFDDEKDMELVQ